MNWRLRRSSSCLAVRRSSSSSSTRRSWAAMAVMRSLGSVGDRTDGVSSGVGGKEVVVVDPGVGRDGYAEGGAMGSVSDRRLVLREAVEPERVGGRVEVVSGKSTAGGCREGVGDGGTESSAQRVAATEVCLSWPPLRGRETGEGVPGRSMASSMLLDSGTVASMCCNLSRRAASMRRRARMKGVKECGGGGVLSRKGGW